MQKKIRKQYCVDTAIFLAGPRWYCCGLFSFFITTFCIGLREKKCVNMIDDDIYNRTVEFKANNEIIKMNGITVILTKKHEEWNTFMSSMLMTKIMPAWWMWNRLCFNNKSGVAVSWKAYVDECIKSCNKTTYFCLKRKLHQKGKVRTFWLSTIVFFRKFDLYNMAF